MLHVEVTAEDIAAGGPRDPKSCPVALAVGRAGVAKAHVTPNYIDGIVGVRGFWRETPEQVARFITAFDDGQPVQPFAFDFDTRAA